MYIVKATSHAGPVSFACGTLDQALDRLADLSSRGFQEVSVKDPKGKEWSAAAFMTAFL